MGNPSEEGKIAVVVGSVTDDKRVYEAAGMAGFGASTRTRPYKPWPRVMSKMRSCRTAMDVCCMALYGR